MADLTLVVDGTDDADNHKFLTLDDALDHAVAGHADLSAYGKLNIDIQYAGNDTEPVTVTGFSGLDDTHYVNIYTSGDAVCDGVWDDTKYRLTRSVVASRPLTILSAYTRVTGLQIASLSTGATGYSPLACGYGTGILLDKCILRCNSSGASGATGIAYISTSGANVTLRNCVCYGSTAGYGVYTVTGTTLTAHNCTFYLPSAAYVAYRAAGTQTFVNCYLGGPADTMAGTITQTTCATSDDSATDVSLRSIAAAVGSGAYFTNVTAGSEDFTLTSASSPLVGAGTTLATFTDDITDAERGATFDIGAFEFVQSYQYARPSSDVADGNWTNELSTNTNNFASIDESTASDTDYVRSGATPSNDTLTVGLSSIDAPIPGTVTMKVRVKTV